VAVAARRPRAAPARKADRPRMWKVMKEPERQTCVGALAGAADGV
jgi:hypothetical protein